MEDFSNDDDSDDDSDDDFDGDEKARRTPLADKTNKKVNNLIFILKFIFTHSGDV